MDWFDQLSGVLSDYYPTASPQDIVGYLRGSSDPKIWRRMAQSRTEQMLILGSVPPTEEQWAAAGVANRGLVQTIRYDDLRTFIITYGGFMVSRPWGKVSILSADVLRNYGMTVTQFRNALPDKSAQKAKLVAAMNNLIDAIKLRRPFSLDRKATSAASGDIGPTTFSIQMSRQSPSGVSASPSSPMPAPR
jgi:hypothetical protein